MAMLTCQKVTLTFHPSENMSEGVNTKLMSTSYGTMNREMRMIHKKDNNINNDDLGKLQQFTNLN